MHDLSRAPEESLARCTASRRYLDTFYELFLADRPLLQRRFAGVDLSEQKRKLAETLPSFLRLPLLPPDSPEVREAMEQHRHTHRSAGSSVTYALWVDTVCLTLRRHDPLYDDAIDAAVRERLGKAVQIVSGHILES